jgi:hypothetical protein
MEIDASNHNRVSGNRVVRAVEGIVFGGDGNIIVHNRVADGVACGDGSDCGAGIVGIGGTGNLVTGNFASRIRGLGIRLNAFEQFGGPPTIGTVIRANVITSASSDGIGVATDSQNSGTVADTLLEANLVIGSGHDGINVASAATTLTRNLAVHNGNVGIEAVQGVTDGGGNHAVANGNPAQCTNVAC